MSHTTTTPEAHIPYYFNAFGWEAFAEYYPRAPFKWFASWHEGGSRMLHIGRWLIIIGRA